MKISNLSRSRKMWLLMVLAVCLVVLQYPIASSWLITNTGNLAGEMPQSNVQAVLDRIQLDHTLVSAVGEKVLREIVKQVGQQVIGDYCNIGGDSLPVEKKIQLQETKLPPLYIITPTYRRPEQIPELTRLAQTLMHVPKVQWLVIEDAQNKSQQITELLTRSGIPFEQLVAPMPEIYKKKKGSKPRGVSNRNKGLQWLRANSKTGVFYFADDDNTYDILLFEEMRYTKKVSMWPVGLCTKFGLSSPIVKNGTFLGFYDGWIAGRKFPVDMAGFAVNVEFLLKRPKASMPYKPGFEEDGFLKSLNLNIEDIELKAENCTKILVWHTQTKKNEPAAALDMSKYNNTNLVQLHNLIV
uniref:Galactosylgalactosylxylosylprotein 3-beta-glucuronosyltransferase n=1 Tax=Clastoptera arizonana TaxID=38151 RepID=A0A1B6CXM4_9HEMI